MCQFLLTFTKLLDLTINQQLKCCYLSLFGNQIVRIKVAQVSNIIAFSVVCDLQIPQLCQVNVQSLLFDDCIIILL